MAPENVRERRGEPVLVTLDDGRECAGTIEFGDERTGISVYLERDGKSGGRIALRDRFERLRPDPGGKRPVWDSFRFR